MEGSKGLKTAGVWQIEGFGNGLSGYGWNCRVAEYISDKLENIGRLEDKEAIP